MKKRVLAMGLSLCLLTSCASMLNRSYASVTAHVDKPTTAEDPSILRVENYRELVSAVLYLVSQGAAEGTIRLYDYAGDVPADLAAACAEVSTQDPLAAYAVEDMEHEAVKVVSYYEAKLKIRYRRTMEQVRSIVSVNGTGAIRTQLRDALYDAGDQVVLRVGYFSGSEESLAQLLSQVYYDTPAVALGMPRAEIRLYPDAGRERVVEILLTYPLSRQEFLERRAALSLAAEDLARDYGDREGEDLARSAARALAQGAAYDPAGPATPYDALVGGKANSEGMALAYSLLCLPDTWEGTWGCRVARGSWRDGQGGEEPRFWNVIALPDGRTLYFDPAAGTEELYTEEEFFALGFRWEGGPEEPAPRSEAEEALQTENP